MFVVATTHLIQINGSPLACDQGLLGSIKAGGLEPIEG